MSVATARGPEVRVSVPSSGVRDKGHLSVALTQGADVTYVSTDTACEGGQQGRGAFVVPRGRVTRWP